jgi:hypothetical protein
MNRRFRSILVEHVVVWTPTPFEEVVRRLEQATGLFDPAVIENLVRRRAPESTVVDAVSAMVGKSGFMRFARFDHGQILSLLGEHAVGVRFLIGHPLIAASMTRHAIGAGLYAPLSLLIAEDPKGGTNLEYDIPSGLLGPFAIAAVTEVAKSLDEKFNALLESLVQAEPVQP